MSNDTSAAFVNYCNGNFQAAPSFSDILLRNCQTLIEKVGHASKAALCSVLLRDVSTQDLRTHFPRVPQSYIQNCRAPHKSACLAGDNIFVVHRTEEEKRNFTHPAEVDALLDWCTTHEFDAHSGDTVERYYRTCSKDIVYWDHYRGSGAGATWIAGMMLHTKPELIADLSLKSPNLTRSSFIATIN